MRGDFCVWQREWEHSLQPFSLMDVIPRNVEQSRNSRSLDVVVGQLPFREGLGMRIETRLIKHVLFRNFISLWTTLWFTFWYNFVHFLDSPLFTSRFVHHAILSLQLFRLGAFTETSRFLLSRVSCACYAGDETGCKEGNRRRVC